MSRATGQLASALGRIIDRRSIMCHFNSLADIMRLGPVSSDEGLVIDGPGGSLEGFKLNGVVEVDP